MRWVGHGIWLRRDKCITGLWLENLKGNDWFEDPGIDGLNTLAENVLASQDDDASWNLFLSCHWLTVWSNHVILFQCRTSVCCALCLFQWPTQWQMTVDINRRLQEIGCSAFAALFIDLFLALGFAPKLCTCLLLCSFLLVL
jgi:hypothetical protein